MRFSSALFLLAAFAGSAAAQLPAGPGHDETVKVCAGCHSAEQAGSLHQTRAQWEETIATMMGMGAEATDKEKAIILDYLSANFPPVGAKPINVNTSSAIELEAAFSLTRAEAAAVVKYRADKGNFKTADDLKLVPGLDFSKIEAKKDRLAF